MRVRRPHGTYSGRLVVIDGVLSADEGEHRGAAVYHDTAANVYRFVQPGEPNHNERHETRVAEMEFTTAESASAGDPAHAHHFGVQPHDDHFDPRGRATGRGGFTHVRLRQHSDRLGPTVTGHTDAHTAQHAARHTDGGRS